MQILILRKFSEIFGSVHLMAILLGGTRSSCIIVLCYRIIERDENAFITLLGYTKVIQMHLKIIMFSQAYIMAFIKLIGKLSSNLLDFTMFTFFRTQIKKCQEIQDQRFSFCKETLIHVTSQFIVREVIGVCYSTQYYDVIERQRYIRQSMTTPMMTSILVDIFSTFSSTFSDRGTITVGL